MSGKIKENQDWQGKLNLVLSVIFSFGVYISLITFVIKKIIDTAIIHRLAYS